MGGLFGCGLILGCVVILFVVAWVCCCCLLLFCYGVGSGGLVTFAFCLFMGWVCVFCDL